MKQTTKNLITIGSTDYTGVYSPDSQLLIKNLSNVLYYSVDNATNWLPCVDLSGYATLSGLNDFTGAHNYFVRIALSEGANSDWVSVNSLEINNADYIRCDTLVPYNPTTLQTGDVSTLGTALLPWLTTFTTNISNGTKSIAVDNIVDKTTNNSFTGTNNFETIVPTYINMNGQSSGMRTPQILRTTGTQDNPWVAVDTLVPYTSGLTLGNGSESWQSVYVDNLVSGTTTIPVADINNASGLYLDMTSSIVATITTLYTLTSAQASSIYSAYTSGKLGVFITIGNFKVRIDFNSVNTSSSAIECSVLNYGNWANDLVIALLSCSSSAGTISCYEAQI